MSDMIPFKRKPIVNMFDEMTKGGFLDSFFKDDFFTRGWSSFKTDITDEGSHYSIEAELPGFKKEDISIDLRDNRLIISAKSKNSIDEEKNNYIRKERHFGEVMRSFTLDDNVKADQIKAKYENGMLRIILPKDEQKQIKGHKIEIE